MIREIDKSKFKSDEVREEWKDIQTKLQDILIDMSEYCLLAQMPFLITDLTSTEAEDIKLKRKSKTHREKRAADLRCTFWSEEFIKEFTDHFSEKYKKWAAVSRSTMKPTLIVRHVGTADHLHVQIKR